MTFGGASVYPSFMKDASWSRDAFGHVPNVTLEPLGPLQVVPANSAAVRERRLGDGFKYLARLQKVALAPQLLADGAVLRRLVDDCPFLNELEIVDWSDDSLRYFIVLFFKSSSR